MGKAIVIEMLIQPCELIVKTLIPSVRAAVSRELIEKHGLRQVDVANFLGVTQAAISQYMRGARGGIMDLSSDEEIMEVVRRIAEGIVKGDLDKYEVSLLTCEICYRVRRKGLYRSSGVKMKGKYKEAIDLVCREYDEMRERSGILERLK
ncbi:helix-turn-helix domain-containing protein [Candidatus Korarchaeum cryptofilum]|uniref:Helix-turn-helix domain-containing protein n=2 Tax=Candidatus Korarchaeum cryptofilum TaxID=498846 RepID=A0A429G9N9_9CREN|nr:helix-turn-helix domain-containing protein [Candidatus Korarchaeum cryptofilum]